MFLLKRFFLCNIMVVQDLYKRSVLNMENFIKKIGWTSILTSVVFAILGLIIYFNPNTTFAIITYIIGQLSAVISIITANVSPALCHETQLTYSYISNYIEPRIIPSGSLWGNMGKCKKSLHPP